MNQKFSQLSAETNKQKVISLINRVAGSNVELAKKIEEYYFNQNFYKKKIDYAYKNLYRFNYDDNLKKYLNVVLNHS
jgi:hypothetical protein